MLKYDTVAKPTCIITTLTENTGTETASEVSTMFEDNEGQQSVENKTKIITVNLPVQQVTRHKKKSRKNSTRLRQAGELLTKSR